MLFRPYFQYFNKSNDLLLNDKMSVCLNGGICNCNDKFMMLIRLKFEYYKHTLVIK